MFRKPTHTDLMRISGALLLALMLLLSACNAPIATLPEVMPGQPTPTVNPNRPTAASETVQVATLVTPTSAADVTPVPPTQAPAAADQPAVSVDVSGVAQAAAMQVVEAVSAAGDGPYWGVMPQYTLLTLQDYPVAGHLMKPQIFVFPVKALGAANENAGKIAAELQTLLQNQQEGRYLPYLPMYNAQQVLRAQVKYLDFKNGKGVRYLTQFDQAVLPINNHELHYTFQGLTSDGQYYVSAVLPVSLASLPADERVTGSEPPEFTSDFAKYLADTTQTLNQQPASAFTPDLSKLDALVQSMEVK